MEDRPGGGGRWKFGRIAQTHFNHIRSSKNIEILLIPLHYTVRNIGLIFRMPSTNKSQSLALLHSCSLQRRSSLLLLLFLYLAGDEISAYQSHSLSQTHQSVQSQCGGVPATATLTSNYLGKWMKSSSWMSEIWIWQISKKNSGSLFSKLVLPTLPLPRVPKKSFITNNFSTSVQGTEERAQRQRQQRTGKRSHL